MWSHSNHLRDPYFILIDSDEERDLRPSNQKALPRASDSIIDLTNDNKKRPSENSHWTFHDPNSKRAKISRVKSVATNGHMNLDSDGVNRKVQPRTGNQRNKQGIDSWVQEVQNHRSPGSPSGRPSVPGDRGNSHEHPHDICTADLSRGRKPTPTEVNRNATQRSKPAASLTGRLPPKSRAPLDSKNTQSKSQSDTTTQTHRQLDGSVSAMLQPNGISKSVGSVDSKRPRHTVRPNEPRPLLAEYSEQPQQAPSVQARRLQQKSQEQNTSGLPDTPTKAENTEFELKEEPYHPPYTNSCRFAMTASGPFVIDDSGGEEVEGSLQTVQGGKISSSRNQHSLSSQKVALVPPSLDSKQRQLQRLESQRKRQDAFARKRDTPISLSTEGDEAAPGANATEKAPQDKAHPLRRIHDADQTISQHRSTTNDFVARLEKKAQSGVGPTAGLNRNTKGSSELEGTVLTAASTLNRSTTKPGQHQAALSQDRNPAENTKVPVAHAGKPARLNNILRDRTEAIDDQDRKRVGTTASAYPRRRAQSDQQRHSQAALNEENRRRPDAANAREKIEAQREDAAKDSERAGQQKHAQTSADKENKRTIAAAKAREQADAQREAQAKESERKQRAEEHKQWEAKRQAENAQRNELKKKLLAAEAEQKIKDDQQAALTKLSAIRPPSEPRRIEVAQAAGSDVHGTKSKQKEKPLLELSIQEERIKTKHINDGPAEQATERANCDDQDKARMHMPPKTAANLLPTGPQSLSSVERLLAGAKVKLASSEHSDDAGDTNTQAHTSTAPRKHTHSNRNQDRSHGRKLGEITAEDAQLVLWRDQNIDYESIAQGFRNRNNGVGKSRETYRKRHSQVTQALKAANVEPCLLQDVASGSRDARKKLNLIVHGEWPPSNITRGRDMLGHFTSYTDIIGEASRVHTPSREDHQRPAAPSSTNAPTAKLSFTSTPRPLSPEKETTHGFDPCKSTRVAGKSINAEFIKAYMESLVQVDEKEEEGESDASTQASREDSPFQHTDYCHYAYQVKRRCVSQKSLDGDGDFEEEEDWKFFGDVVDSMDEANLLLAQEVFLLPDEWKGLVVTLPESVQFLETSKGMKQSTTTWTGVGVVELAVEQFQRVFKDRILPRSKQGWLPRAIFVVQKRVTKRSGDGMLEESKETVVQKSVGSSYTTLELANIRAIQCFTKLTFEPTSRRLERRAEEVQCEESRLKRELDQKGEGEDGDGAWFVGVKEDEDKKLKTEVWVEESELEGPRN